MTTLAKILHDAAQHAVIGGSVAMLELQSYDPHSVLLGLKISLEDKNFEKTRDDYLKMGMRTFVTQHLLSTAGDDVRMTGSCGVTSGWIYHVVSGAEAQNPPLQDTQGILKELAGVKDARWFGRLSCGQHSFLIECSDGQYAIYQSFFGSQNLDETVNNILSGKFVFHDKGDFLSRLDVGLCGPIGSAHGSTPASRDGIEIAKGVAGMTQQAAQASVFHGQHWTTDPKSRFEINTSPHSPDKIAETLSGLIDKYKSQWEALLKDSPSSTLGAALAGIG